MPPWRQAWMQFTENFSARKIWANFEEMRVVRWRVKGEGEISFRILTLPLRGLQHVVLITGLLTVLFKRAGFLLNSETQADNDKSFRICPKRSPYLSERLRNLSSLHDVIPSVFLLSVSGWKSILAVQRGSRSSSDGVQSLNVLCWIIFMFLIFLHWALWSHKLKLASI